jgi:hypothetical protein
VVNPFREINWQPGIPERRKFARSLFVGFPVVAVVVFGVGRMRGWDGGEAAALAVGGAGAALGLILWVVPQFVRSVYVIWYAVACSLGWVMGNAMLAAIYCLMVAPMGLTLRALGRKSFQKGFDRRAPSYWRDAPPAENAERYYRQF